MSPNERWIAFYARMTPDRTRLYLAPWRELNSVPESAWVALTDGTSQDTTPVWSPGGNVLYFASDRDGFNSVYAQQFNQQSGSVEGSPFAVRHLHVYSERAGNLGVSNRGFGVAMNKLVLTIERLAGNIWLLE